MRAVILGGGHAGGAAALALAGRHGVSSVTVIGEEMHPPYERPSLSKGFLAGDEPQPTWLADSWPEGVILRLGTRAERVDRKIQAVTTSIGEVIEYDILFLAMGARCRTLEGIDGEHVSVLRSIEDAERLREHLSSGKHLLVIGGGVIGLEAAATGRALGAEVTVLEAAPRIMARNAPEDVARKISALHKERGVRIFTNCAAEKVETRKGVTVELSGGETLVADHLLVGIGVIPNMELAQKAGLECGRGVRVDNDFRTSDPAIFAIGDVAEGPQGCRETWANAQESAERAVCAALGDDLPMAKAPYFWTDQHGVSFQFAGCPLDADQAIERVAGDVRLYFKNGRLVAGATVDQPREMAALRKLLDKGISVTPDEAQNEQTTLRSLTRRATAPA